MPQTIERRLLDCLKVNDARIERARHIQSEVLADAQLLLDDSEARLSESVGLELEMVQRIHESGRHLGFSQT